MGQPTRGFPFYKPFYLLPQRRGNALEGNTLRKQGLAEIYDGDAPKTRRRKKMQRLNEQTRTEILQAISDGLSLQDSASLVRISPEDIDEYIKVNSDFGIEIARTEAEYKRQLLKVIDGGGDKANHARWILERRWPEQYARTPVSLRSGEKQEEKPKQVKKVRSSRDYGGSIFHELKDEEEANRDNGEE